MGSPPRGAVALRQCGRGGDDSPTDTAVSQRADALDVRLKNLVVSEVYGGAQAMSDTGAGARGNDVPGFERDPLADVCDDLSRREDLIRCTAVLANHVSDSGCQLEVRVRTKLVDGHDPGSDRC